MLLFRKLTLVAVAVVASLPVLAVPTLRLFDGTTTVTVQDGSAGDSSALANVINYSGVIGVWNINVSTASSLGTSSSPLLSLVNFNNATAAGTMTIEFSETDFDQDPLNVKVFTGGINPSGGSTTASSLYDAANTVFAGTQLTSFTSAADSYNKTVFAGASPLAPYSLTLKSVLTATAAGTFGSTIQLTGVPEPGFYGALALGLSGLFAAVVRRRKSSNV